MKKSSEPKRIQRKRTKGWEMPPLCQYVGRPTKWGNPYRVGPDGTAADCVKKYRDKIAGNLWSFPTKKDIQLLRGLNLACWCGLDQPCHADVLLEIANEEVRHGK